MLRIKSLTSLARILSTMVIALLVFIPQPLFASPFDLNISSSEELEAYIKKRTQDIQAEPKNTKAYIERGDAQFLAHDFDAAVEDYTAALNINDALDEAYFGRGLAKARSGFIEGGIEDLSVYIKRNPNSSIAYTKRGVRYLWLGDQEKAKADLESALKINPRNAEAHDDIGVIFAKRKEYQQAAYHFMSAFTIDPTYQKAYYNMAMISYFTGNDDLALKFVDDALKLAPEVRNALILKAKILEALGRKNESDAILEEAEFLPGSNWSESVPLK